MKSTKADVIFGAIQAVLLIGALLAALPFLLGLFATGYIWRQYGKP
jgi:hypothetical protein